MKLQSIILFLLLYSFSFTFAQSGPANGTLILVGGGGIPAEAMEIFIKNMGGQDKPLIVVPTSAPDESINLERENSIWQSRGFTNVKVLHTIDPEVANTLEFVAPLKEATAIWFGGGRQWRCIDAYKNTLAEKEFHKLLERGGVIMGNSAGASVQGSFLARGGEASNIPIIAPEKEHQIGFGFLKDMAVDQHADARNRWMEMQEIIAKHPEILGISIAENTAVIIQQNHLEVFGNGKIALHHKDFISKKSKNKLPYKYISCGQIFNLKTKRIK